jgi:hypothetical protein
MSHWTHPGVSRDRLALALPSRSSPAGSHGRNAHVAEADFLGAGGPANPALECREYLSR